MSFFREFRKWFTAYPDLEQIPDLAGDTTEAVQRAHAVLQAQMMGAQSRMGEIGWHCGSLFLTRGKRKFLRDLVDRATSPCLLVDPRPGLHIVDENDACASVSFTDRWRIRGERLFTVFPDNPDIAEATGVTTLFESLRKTVREARAQPLPVHRYDLADPSGKFVERHWRTVNAPILDDAGHVIYLLICPTRVPPPARPRRTRPASPPAA